MDDWLVVEGRSRIQPLRKEIISGQFKDHFSGASDRYLRYRPTYPAELFELLLEVVPGRQLACDVACGNGQVAVELARYFDQVLATDASVQQISQAMPRRNIDYRVALAEELPAAAGSVDLVAVGQAIHWFDHPRFFAEVERVLRPGGVLAAWGYNFLEVGDPELSTILKSFRRTVEPYWPPERALLDHSYDGIDFPYPNLELEGLTMAAHWSLEELLGYLGTWSAVKEYRAQHGEDPVEPLLERFESLENPSPREVVWPLVLYVGQKPSG